MIDLQHLEQYRENNRIEAKKALGGLPHSIWETYSAFANALGGIILLGVEEYRDKSLHPVDLPDPEGLVQEFWDRLNDPHTASVNILLNRDVQIETVEGKHIIVITVPRAQRFDRPVFVEGSPRNSYRRSGEGDYRCTEDELRAMYRDAAVKTQDMAVLEHPGPELFCRETLNRYRSRLLACQPGGEWESLGDEDLLLRLGALGRGKDGSLHPTAAGLLMFGSQREILREYPAYCLEYRETSGSRRAYRIRSGAGAWSGNVFDFFSRVCGRLARRFQASALDVLRETLVNCLVNADYYGQGGVTVVKTETGITLSNPGSFRVELNAARCGGVSDPRNGTLLKLFHMIDAGECSGSGIPKIIRICRELGWTEPKITQSFSPDLITVSLSFSPELPQRATAAAGTKTIPTGKAVRRQLVIDYLTDHARASTAEIAAYLGLSPSTTRSYLAALVRDGIVAAEGMTQNRFYKLKA
jgi:predicted HTH transcriptional regulator